MVAGKKRTLILSWAATAGAIVLLSGLGIFILRGQLYTNALLARNDGERTLNLLLSTLRAERRNSEEDPVTGKAEKETEERVFFNPVRDMREFSRIAGDHPVLGEKILSLGAYTPLGDAVFRFGAAPEKLEKEFLKEPAPGFPPRFYAFEDSNRSLRIVHPALDSRVFRRTRKSEAETSAEGARERTPEPSREYTALFFEIRQDAYWLRNRVAYGVFIGWEFLLVLLTLLVRDTLLKNMEYRGRIRDQRQLVALGSAARTLAHEIKNPLSAIQLQADVIARVCPSAVGNEVGAIGQEVRRLHLLVDRIGDFLREPRGTPERIDLRAFVGETIYRIAPDLSPPAEEAPGAGPRDGGALYVSMDPERLRSVVENLLRNALESGGPRDRIEVGIFTSGEGVVLDILDRGEGLPAGEAEQLFDPFFTSKRGGSGIGLSISRRFVEAAGGKISLHDREGGGASVRVVLPGYAS
jgi:two-component system sensor histidine kinase HydH